MILNQKTSRTAGAALTVLVGVTMVAVALIANLVGLTRPYLLGDPGDLVRWGLPIAKAITNVAMAGAIGGAVLAAFALPDQSRGLHRAHNLVAASAVGWVLF
ncbi:MAG: copper transporter, partial [Micrococcales bacterium]